MRIRRDHRLNNAAVVAPLGASTDVDVEELARAFTLNVTSVAELTFAPLPGMLERRWGRVVNVSSGIVATPAAMVGANAYASTKAAIEAHTVNLAAELAGDPITPEASAAALIRRLDGDATGEIWDVAEAQAA